VTARQESVSEYGPWGGIPGIFAELASEACLPYKVHTAHQTERPYFGFWAVSLGNRVIASK
jgi:hypothetical protein